MRKYIVTPWKDDEELLMVRRLLFGGRPISVGERYFTTDQCSQAINLINAWKCRGRVPHAMDATALLIEARLFASKGSNSSGENRSDGLQIYESPTDGLIRALYAAAFSRFVTGFCDSRQTSNHKQTMYEVAATIGMPVTFVDLRHECAHADPPSRYRLERSVGQALDWMWEIYWSRLGDEGEHELISSEDEYGLQDNGDEAVYSVAENVNADDVPEKQQLQGSLRVVLKNYLATRKNVVCQRREDGYDVNIARSEESSIRSTYKELMQICERKANRLHILQTVLLEIKIMLPSTEATSDTMETAFGLWDSLLQHIAQRQPPFLSGLARMMLATLSKISVSPTSTTSTAAALHAWLSHILTSKIWLPLFRVSGSSSSSSSNKSETRLHQQIISECLLVPIPRTIRLAHAIVSAGSPSLQRDWAPAVNACLPLLEEWASGPDSISGNGGYHERLEALDVPLSDVSLPDANDDDDYHRHDPELQESSTILAKSHDARQQQQRREQQEERKEDNEEHRALAVHGWKMWTGKWTPTPIGVVAN